MKARKADAGSLTIQISNPINTKEKVLQPIYDELLKYLTKVGSDVTVTRKDECFHYIRKSISP